MATIRSQVLAGASKFCRFIWSLMTAIELPSFAKCLSAFGHLFEQMKSLKHCLHCALESIHKKTVILAFRGNQLSPPPSSLYVYPDLMLSHRESNYFVDIPLENCQTVQNSSVQINQVPPIKLVD